MPQAQIEKLQAKVAELEERLADEREEYEWDLKAAKESSAASVQKLEQEVAQLKDQLREKSHTDDVDLLTRRALVAERKVAELKQEIKSSKRLGGSPNDDYKQRAEKAEKERDQLQRENQKLERTLEEKSRVCEQAEKRAKNTSDLKRELDEAKRTILKKEGELSALREKATSRQTDSVNDKEHQAVQKELLELKEEYARATRASGQMLEQRERETLRLKDDLEAAKQKESQLTNELETARLELQKELEQVRHELDQATGQLERNQAKEIFDQPTIPMGQPLVLTCNDKDSDQQDSEQISIGQLLNADPSLEQSILSPPETEQDEKERFLASQPAIPAELINFGDEPGISTKSFPVISSDQAAGLRNAELNGIVEPTFAKGETNPGQPPIPAQAETDDFVVEWTGEEDSLIREHSETHKQAPTAPKQDSFQAQDLDTDFSSLLQEEDLDLQEPNSNRQPAIDQVTPTQKKSPKKTATLLGLCLAMALIASAWFLFPRWFGLAGQEDTTIRPSVTSEPDDSTQVGSSQPADKTPSTISENLATEEQPLTDPGDAEEQPLNDSVAANPDEPTPADEPIDELTIKPESDSDPADNESSAAYQRGLSLLKQRKYRKAIKISLSLTKQHPQSAKIRYLYSRALFYRKRFDAAVQQMEKAIELDPKYTEAYYQLGGMYIKVKKRARARKALNRFIELAPSDDKRVSTVRKNIRKM